MPSLMLNGRVQLGRVCSSPLDLSRDRHYLRPYSLAKRDMLENYRQASARGRQQVDRLALTLVVHSDRRCLSLFVCFRFPSEETAITAAVDAVGPSAQVERCEIVKQMAATKARTPTGHLCERMSPAILVVAGSEHNDKLLIKVSAK